MTVRFYAHIVDTDRWVIRQLCGVVQGNTLNAAVFHTQKKFAQRLEDYRRTLPSADLIVIRGKRLDPGIRITRK